MSALISSFDANGVITVNRLVLKADYTIDDLEERVALLCENVKTYHSESGFLGGMVVAHSGQISNEGSRIGQALESPLKDREALILTFWRSFEEHEASHRSASFQPLFLKVLELCENGNEEIAYRLLWSGTAYPPEEARAAREAKQRYGG